MEFRVRVAPAVQLTLLHIRVPRYSEFAGNAGFLHGEAPVTAAALKDEERDTLYIVYVGLYACQGARCCATDRGEISVSIFQEHRIKLR